MKTHSMFRTLTLFLATSICLSSCSNSEDDLSEKKAIGGAVYGGEFRFMSSEKISNIFPLQSVDIYTSRVTAQIFDPILKLNPENNEVEPSIAESIKASENGKEYTLKIRKGVYFHQDDCFDDEDRELTANDVKFTLDLACSGLDINEVSSLLVERIEGAEAFYNKTSKSFDTKGVSGIQVIDENTLKIKLVEPYAGFDKLLCYGGFSVFAKEAYDTYGNEIGAHPIGTGPFKLDEMTQDHIRLTRNGKYWQKDEFGNQLPFLGSIMVTYTTDKTSELKAFRNADIDLVLEIPVEEVKNILGSLKEAQSGKTVKHKVDTKASASITFAGLNHNNPALSDQRVRLAMNLALDRNQLVNGDLLGEGYPDEHGIIPNCNFYDATQIKGYKFNLEKAKSLMAQAGFAEGKGFPTLRLVYAGKKGTSRELMASGIARQLKDNLGINVKLINVDVTKRDKMAMNGQADIWLIQWIADYPDGENFLNLFYSGKVKVKSNYINPFKYKSAEFNSTFVNMNKELDPEKRMKLMMKADQILVDDAVVMPILTDDIVTLINSRVRNFESNSLEILDLSTIFIKELRE